MSSAHPPVYRRGRRLAVALGGLVLLAGCGRGSTGAAGSAPAAEELKRAAQATLAASSFVIHVAPNASVGERTIVYQAPDRIHDTDDTREHISIGQTFYFRVIQPNHRIAPPAGRSRLVCRCATGALDRA